MPIYIYIYILSLYIIEIYINTYIVIKMSASIPTMDNVNIMKCAWGVLK